MRSISILILGLALMLNSCGKIYLRLRYDIRDFKPRSTPELMKYLHKKGVAYDLHFRITEEAFQKQSVSSYKPGWKSGLRPIQALAFDSSGKLVMQWAVCEGFFETIGTFDTFPPKHTGFLSEHSLKQEFLQFTESIGNTPDISSLPPHDLALVVYWSRAFGEMSLRSIRSAEVYRNQYREKRILLILVSLDPQQEWESER